MRDALNLATAPAWNLRADPAADDTIAAVLAEAQDFNAISAAIGIVNSQIALWDSNGMLADWQAGADVPAHIALALQAYVRSQRALPEWADAAKIARAETLFMEMSMMSCTLLFCASLPQCYVVPDLAGVLQVAGQLTAHTDYRIRSTAAMLFPVMMRDGLTGASGFGVAQTLKVRLIHATIRHLILRGNPSDAVRDDAPAVVPPLVRAATPTGLHQSLYTQGWDVAQHGLPCNQEELAYTLLTFHYIFLMGLRKQGIGLSTADEEAYLHAWNVMGHVLGIERTLMADTMEQATALFERIQTRGRARPYLPDPRPALGAALMQTMADELPLRILKPLPVLMTRYLCGPATSADLALDSHVSLFSRALFAIFMGLTRAIDTLVRQVLPEFSLSRMIGRVAGYNLTVKLLMDQTRPLKLPDTLLNQVDATTRSWQDDPKAPGWVNWVEQRMTGRRQARKDAR